ncbi:hypothetical protein HYW35_02695 [Candidatus Saccharibacteria bacterium]|nr:hypothetical protein [Candidatus Saccharibacteria bacterium]
MKPTEQQLERAGIFLQSAGVDYGFDETQVPYILEMLARSETALSRVPSGYRHTSELRSGDYVVAVLGERTPSGVTSQLIFDSRAIVQELIDNFMWHKHE